MTSYLSFAKRLAKQAGRIMVKHFSAGITKRIKADKTIVTIADEEVNALVIREIEKKYPTHSVWGEEASVDKQSTYIWVCDPIDGTVPYSKGFAISVFSLALLRD